MEYALNLSLTACTTFYLTLIKNSVYVFIGINCDDDHIVYGTRFKGFPKLCSQNSVVGVYSIEHF